MFYTEHGNYYFYYYFVLLFIVSQPQDTMYALWKACPRFSVCHHNQLFNWYVIGNPQYTREKKLFNDMLKEHNQCFLAAILDIYLFLMISSCSKIYLIYRSLENNYSYSTLKQVQNFTKDKGFQNSSINIIKLLLLFLLCSCFQQDKIGHVMLLCNEHTCWLLWFKCHYWICNIHFRQTYVIV